MPRVLFLLVGFVLALGACTQRMICPAYQSAFVHDQAALSRRVSYFNEDSTPKILTVSKNKYLIIPEQSYRKKIRSMQTVAMKPVYTVVPDSLQEKKANEFAGAESDSTVTPPADSLKQEKKKDSVYVISTDREVRILLYSFDSSKYRIENVMFTSDQDNYMWYFRDVLVLPDVRAALESEKNAKEGKTADGKAIKKAKKGGFFKNLFKKKPKNDTTAVSAIAPSDQATDSASVSPPVEKKKGGLFKRKKNKVEANPAKPVDPAKKEDDGF